MRAALDTAPGSVAGEHDPALRRRRIVALAAPTPDPGAAWIRTFGPRQADLRH
jgi:hypothetical protein